MQNEELPIEEKTQNEEMPIEKRTPIEEVLIEEHTPNEEIPLEEIPLEEKTVERQKTPLRKDRHSPAFESFLKELEGHTAVEAKIECAIGYMEKSIAKEDAADFKGFWDARMKCLELFKENVPQFLRNQLWIKFSELSKEARRLKDLLDEQSNFAAEQIDIAIKAIEEGLDHIEDQLAAEPDLEIASQAYALNNNYNLYNYAQRELNILNIFAARITALRKELIKTEMRVRVKNKFFERMSKAGDRVFPRRKELIQEISHAFTSDVEEFIQQHFGNVESRISIFDLREEIKAMQSAAKFFTLNTQSFSQTRLHLSECWDKLKEKDKERKVEFDKKRELFKENGDELMAQIAASLVQFEAGEINLHQAMAFLEGMVTEMRARELGRDELKVLREQLSAYREKIQMQQKAQDDERQRQEEERTRLKKENFNLFKNKCAELFEKGQDMSAEELVKARDLLNEEVALSNLSKLEKIEIEKALKPLKDILREKREKALLALPADERLALEQLKELLIEKREHRQEIKERLEQFRKLLGASGLSFEKSLDYNERIGEEKEALEKAQLAVREIEIKIETLEKNLS